MTNEEIIRLACEKIVEDEVSEMNKQLENVDLASVTFSDNFKRKMNRMFREKIGSANIPHPEADNIFERERSKIITLFKK